MNIQIGALFVNLAIALAVTLAAANRPRAGVGRSLAALALLSAAWSLCDLLMQRVAVPGIHPVLVALIYLLASLAVAAQFLYVVRQANREHWVNRVPHWVLAIMPVLTQILYWIPATNRALFANPTPSSGAVLFLASTWGKVNALYLFSLLGVSVMLLWNTFLERPRALRIRLGGVLVGSLIPPTAAAFEFAGFNPLAGTELLPIGLAVACAAYAAYFFRRGADTFSSIDRNAVVEGMDDGWMVLDQDNIVVDMNSAAERMAGLSRAQVLGQPIAKVLNGLPNLGETFNTSQEVEMKRSIKSEAGWKYLNIRISPLADRERRPFGRLALWHDVTERRLTEDARLRARDEMLVLLNAISSAASNVVDLDEFLSESIYHIIYPFRSQVVGIFLVDEKGEESKEPNFMLNAHLGLPAHAVTDLGCVPASSPLFEAVFTSRQALQVEEVDTDPRVPVALRGISLACLLMLPLVVQSGESSHVIGCIALARKEKPVFSMDETVRLSMISDQIATLIDGDRRRKLAITSTERKRVMRDLHDSVSQKLYGLVTTTEAAQAAIEAGSTVDPSEILARIGENARQAVKEMRLFLFQMQPIDMEKDGLISLLHHRLAAVEGRADIKAQFRADLADDEIALSKQTEVVLYYIAMEALNNVLKHAGAKAVSVTLKQGRRNVILEIRDDGCGFDPRKVERGGLGLINMQERTSQIHGKLQIVSKPGEGSKVVITVPRDPTVKLVKHKR